MARDAIVVLVIVLLASAGIAIAALDIKAPQLPDGLSWGPGVLLALAIAGTTAFAVLGGRNA